MASKNKCIIAAFASNPECARAAKRAGADIVYVSALNYKRGCAQKAGRLCDDSQLPPYPKNTVLAIPKISHDFYNTPEERSVASRESKVGLDVWNYVKEGADVYVDSLGALYRASKAGCSIHSGLSLNITNSDSLSYVSSFETSLIWLSEELNLSQIKYICKHSKANTILGVKVAGAQELMVCEHCVFMSEGPCAEQCIACKRRKCAHSLVDEKGYSFPVITDILGRSHVYNSVNLDVIHDIPQLIDAGIYAFMIDTTLMDEEQTAHAIGRSIKAIELTNFHETLPKQPNTTSGHLHRGLK